MKGLVWLRRPAPECRRGNAVGERLEEMVDRQSRSLSASGGSITEPVMWNRHVCRNRFIACAESATVLRTVCSIREVPTSAPSSRSV